MEKLIFDSGIKEYQLGNGVLRFNPADPNVYARFMEALEKIQVLETELVEDAKAQITPETEAKSGEIVVQLLAKADREAKNILNWVFGSGNDFAQILNGVSLLAVGENGERVITNLIHALTPIIQEGAEKCAQQQTGAAVAKAKGNRAQRRAQAKK